MKMTTIKSYYKNGIITVSNGNCDLQNGPAEITIRQTPRLSEKLKKYKGSMKIRRNTQAVQE